MKLLIVDDSTLIRRSIERFANKFQFTEIRTAGNGATALKEFHQFMPDAITMDITMPEMDGLTCVEAIMREKPEAKILVISALADKSTAVEAIKRGASGFLLKPFTEETLIESLEELFED